MAASQPTTSSLRSNMSDEPSSQSPSPGPARSGQSSSPSASALTKREPPPRRRFSQVHIKDQQIKQTKKLCIEANWQCDIMDAIPAEFRPKVEHKKGSKILIGDRNMHDEHWWNWSVELIKAIEELSSMTTNDHVFAYSLLRVEVEARQMNPRSPKRRVQEIVLGDVQRVLEDVRKRLADANAQDSSDATYDANNTQLAIMDQSQLGNPYASYQQEYHQTKRLKGPPGPVSGTEAASSSLRAPGMTQDRARSARSRIMPPATAGPSSTQSPGSSGSGGYSQDAWRADQGRVTDLKVKATRMRAEAARLEAEAAELEIQARELREQAE